MKIRVHELGKELGLESKEIIKRLGKMGFEAKNHMSQVDDKYADSLRAAAGPKSGASGGFVPKVTRIPKAVVQEKLLEQEQEQEQKKSAEAAVPPPAEIAAPAEAAPRPEEKAAETAPPPPAKEKEPPAAPPSEKAGTVKAVPEEKTAEKPEKPAGTERGVEAKKEPFLPGIPRPEYQKPPRPQGTGQFENRPPRPQGAGQFENRPPRPQGTGQFENRPPRPQGAGQYENRPPRPQGAGQYENRPPRPQGSAYPSRPGAAPAGAFQQKSGFGGKDKDGAYDARKDRGGKNPRPQGGAKAASPGASEMKYTPSPIEKPSANYRQEKKVFTKDVVFERVSTEEKEHGFSKGPRGARGKVKRNLKKEMPPVVPKKVIIPQHIVLADLAKNMGKTAAELIKKLLALGIMATINQELDSDAAILLGEEFGITVEVQADRAVEIMEDSEDEEETMTERPPVVTVMGHVDHGKTSLLDAIRQTNVIATEAGGITQHIGAYQVEINGKKITFLDTPGHEAFTAMRARGAQVTDISILVVAADDGVMPQTIEAINHSKAAGVPIIVAINKIDKPTANPGRVKQNLMDYGLVAEEWGGEDIMVPVSAKKGEGIENLLEMILLVAEMRELKANPKRHARGTVVEAELDKAKGPVATLLVQKGTLRVGDSILAGAVFGKVRAMNDDKGRKVRAAGPSMPVEVMGFSEVPPAGEVFIAVKDDKDARLVAYKQQVKKREEELRKSSKVSLEDLFKQISEGEIKELNIILKADVQGSVEALGQAILKLNTDEVKVKILHAGVGGISESDIMLASASNAIIIGFNIRADNNAKKSAEQENVDVRLYRVIYDATSDIKKAMSGLLAPQFKEQIIGHAQVRTLFKVPKAGMIAGSYVTDGKIVRSCNVRLLRDLVVVMEGKIDSLRRFKDDVKEVASGFECGIGLENFNDIKENDIIEAFVMEEIKREL